MRLTIRIKTEIANFFQRNNLAQRKSKYKIIKNFLYENYGFSISIKRIRIFVKQWLLTGNLCFKSLLKICMLSHQCFKLLKAQ